jgi:uncharacterized membrane-anchored protein
MEGENFPEYEGQNDPSKVYVIYSIGKVEAAAEKGGKRVILYENGVQFQTLAELDVEKTYRIDLKSEDVHCIAEAPQHFLPKLHAYARQTKSELVRMVPDKSNLWTLHLKLKK